MQLSQAFVIQKTKHTNKLTLLFCKGAARSTKISLAGYSSTPDSTRAADQRRELQVFRVMLKTLLSNPSYAGGNVTPTPTPPPSS